jgi:MFS family permease
MRLALVATGQGAMNAATPLLGGLIAATLGFEVLFGLSVALLVLALGLLILLVEEPRNRRRVA